MNKRETNDQNESTQSDLTVKPAKRLALERKVVRVLNVTSKVRTGCFEEDYRRH